MEVARSGLWGSFWGTFDRNIAVQRQWMFGLFVWTVMECLYCTFPQFSDVRKKRQNLSHGPVHRKVS